MSVFGVLDALRLQHRCRSLEGAQDVCHVFPVSNGHGKAQVGGVLCAFFTHVHVGDVSLCGGQG